jgi:hypothetical protein
MDELPPLACPTKDTEKTGNLMMNTFMFFNKKYKTPSEAF